MPSLKELCSKANSTETNSGTATLNTFEPALLTNEVVIMIGHGEFCYPFSMNVLVNISYEVENLGKFS